MKNPEFRFSASLSTAVPDSVVLLVHGPRRQQILPATVRKRPVRALPVVPEGHDEEAAPPALLAHRPEDSGQVPADAPAGTWPTTCHGLPARPSATAAAASRAGEPVRVLLIGDCVTQFTEEPPHLLGRDVRAGHRRPGPSADPARAIRRTRPDVAACQPDAQSFPTDPSDGAHTCDGEERAHRPARTRPVCAPTAAPVGSNRWWPARTARCGRASPPTVAPTGPTATSPAAGCTSRTGPCTAFANRRRPVRPQGRAGCPGFPPSP